MVTSTHDRKSRGVLAFDPIPRAGPKDPPSSVATDQPDAISGVLQAGEKIPQQSILFRFSNLQPIFPSSAGRASYTFDVEISIVRRGFRRVIMRVLAVITQFLRVVIINENSYLPRTLSLQIWRRSHSHSAGQRPKRSEPRSNRDGEPIRSRGSRDVRFTRH